MANWWEDDESQWLDSYFDEQPVEQQQAAQPEAPAEQDYGYAEAYSEPTPSANESYSQASQQEDDGGGGSSDGGPNTTSPPPTNTTNPPPTNTTDPPAWNAEEWLKQQGVAASVAKEEASNIQRYGSAAELFRANGTGALDNLKTRGSRQTLSGGGIGGDIDTDGDGKLDPGWESKGNGNYSWLGGQFNIPASNVSDVKPGSFSDEVKAWLAKAGTQPAPRTTTTPTGRTGGGGTNTSMGGAEGFPDFESLMAQLLGKGQRFGGPGDPGVFPAPVQQVGQDPLSQAITGGYADMIGSWGQTALGKDLDQTLRGLISRGGAIDEDPASKAARLEAARQPIDALRRAQIDSSRGELASRGLVSEPGAPQGSEISALGRIEERIAPYYATAAQQLAGDDARANDERLSQALSMVGDLSQQQSAMFLASLGAATDRQRILSEIALATLDRNLLWNQFLAELGIDRGQALEEIQRGRIDDMMELVLMFRQYVDASAGGYI